MTGAALLGKRDSVERRSAIRDLQKERETKAREARLVQIEELRSRQEEKAVELRTFRAALESRKKEEREKYLSREQAVKEAREAKIAAYLAKQAEELPKRAALLAEKAEQVGARIKEATEARLAKEARARVARTEQVDAWRSQEASAVKGCKTDEAKERALELFRAKARAESIKRRNAFLEKEQASREKKCAADHAAYMESLNKRPPVSVSNSSSSDGTSSRSMNAGGDNEANKSAPKVDVRALREAAKKAVKGLPARLDQIRQDRKNQELNFRNSMMERIENFKLEAAEEARAEEERKASVASEIKVRLEENKSAYIKKVEEAAEARKEAIKSFYENEATRLAEEAEKNAAKQKEIADRISKADQARRDKYDQLRQRTSTSIKK